MFLQETKWHWWDKWESEQNSSVFISQSLLASIYSVSEQVDNCRMWSDTPFIQMHTAITIFRTRPRKRSISSPHSGPNICLIHGFQHSITRWHGLESFISIHVDHNLSTPKAQNTQSPRPSEKAMHTPTQKS